MKYFIQMITPLILVLWSAPSKTDPLSKIEQPPSYSQSWKIYENLNPRLVSSITKLLTFNLKQGYTPSAYIETLLVNLWEDTFKNTYPNYAEINKQTEHYLLSAKHDTIEIIHEIEDSLQEAKAEFELKPEHRDVEAIENAFRDRFSSELPRDTYSFCPINTTEIRICNLVLIDFLNSRLHYVSWSYVDL